MLSSQSPKKSSKHQALDLIRFTPGGISRVELARKMGLTRAAITAIIDDLKEDQLVREVERHYPSGRLPIVLEINPERGYVIGIDMGATHVTLVLSDFSSRVIREIEAPLDIILGPRVCLNEIDTLVHTLISDEHLNLKDIQAIGLGVPGPILNEEGSVVGPPIMPGWDNFPIRKHLEQLWHCPVSLDNDANLGALGEWAYGAGRGEQNIVFIKVGTGVGAGILVNNEVYSGSNGSAGEIGHITIDENGPICSCGNRGCLEAFAGGRAIARQAQEAIQKGQRTLLSDITPHEEIRARDVLEAARRGDLMAQRIVADAGAHLGTAIASLVNLVNPSLVVIGGDISQIGDLLLEPIRRTVQQRSLKIASRNLRIATTLLGHRSSAMGAVVQALSVTLHGIAEKDRKEVMR